MELYYKRAECFLDQFNEYYGVTEPTYEGTTPDFFYDYDVVSMQINFFSIFVLLKKQINKIEAFVFFFSYRK